jgi:hypothetical protein
MGAREAIADSVHGASEIQTNFAARTQLIVGAVAAAIAVGIAAQLTTSDFSFPGVTSGAWLAVLVLIVGLAQGRGALFPTGLVALTCLALLELLNGRLATVQGPLIGGALLGTAELGYWSIELAAGVSQTQPVILRRVGVILGLVVFGAGLSAMVAILGTF